MLPHVGAIDVASANFQYPMTEKIVSKDDFHGLLVQDNYRWLEDKTGKTKEWVERQHACTLSRIGGTPHAKWLKTRFDELLRYDDSTVPYELKKSERVFYWTKTKDQDRWAYCTKKQKDAKAEILLDPNTWPKEKTLDVASPSQDGRYLAYGTAEGGNENPVIRILDLKTGELLPDKLCGRKQQSIHWHPDCMGFFYTAHPLKGEVPEGEEEYWHSVYFHKLKTPSQEDKKVFFSNDNKELYHMAFVTEDGRYEIYYRSQFSKQEVYFRPYGEEGSLIPLAAGLDSEYSVDIFRDKIYILTDSKAPMNQLFVTGVNSHQRENWKVLIPEKENSKIESFNIIEGRLYVERLENAYTRIEIYDLEGNYLRDIPLPGIGTASVGGFQDEGKSIYVGFSSFFHPREKFTYDFASNTLTSIHRTPIKADVDKFECKQVWFSSKDGTKVSMFVLSGKDCRLDGTCPTLLTGYGGFNICRVPLFSTVYLSWLEAGGIVAIPNLRGGGEYGQKWHEAGMKEKKQNVFDDFIAASKYLIDQGYTSSSKLAIQGGSNGGLLVGAALTQRPDLFKAVLCQVPLLDMLNYHKWGLANIWAEEYGSSENPEEFRYLLDYSPYHNVKNGVHYPAALITAGENDTRVHPCHAKKMAARLQEASASKNPIMFYFEGSSGHQGGTTLTQNIEQSSHLYGFLMSELGMKIP